MPSDSSLFAKARKHIDMSHVKKLREEEIQVEKEKKKLYEEYLEGLRNNNHQRFSDWRFELDEGMTCGNVMAGTTFPGVGEVDLSDLPANDESTYSTELNGQPVDAFYGGVAIKDSGTGTGSDGGFNLGQSYLAFDGDGIGSEGLRIAYLDMIDTSKFDTMILTAIRGNDSNGGEDPDEEGAQLRLYYDTSWSGNGPYQSITKNDKGEDIPGQTDVIIPLGNDTANLRSWVIHLPAHVRNAKTFFAFYQNKSSSTGFDNYGITQVRFQRRAPVTVFVSLDDPQASAFVRTEPTFAGLTQEQKLKKLQQMIQDSDEYLKKVFGKDFPGTGAAAPGSVNLGSEEPSIQVTNYPQGPTEDQDPSDKSFYDLYKDELEKSFKKPGQDNTDTYQQWIQTQPDKYNDPENYGFTGSESEPEPETRSNQEQSSYYPPAEDLADIGAKTPPPPREYGDRGKYFDDYYSKSGPKTDNDYVNGVYGNIKVLVTDRDQGSEAFAYAQSLNALEEQLKGLQDALDRMPPGTNFIARIRRAHVETEILNRQADIDQLKTTIIRAARSQNQRYLNAKNNFEIGGTFDEYIDAYYQSHPEDVKDLINTEVENVESGVTDYKFSPLAKRIVDVILNLPEGLPLPYFSSAKVFAQYAKNIIDSNGKSGGVIENPLIDKEVNDILKNVDLNQIGEYGKAETLFQSGIAALTAGHTTFGSGGYTVEITDDGITITDPSYKFAKGGANPIPDQAWGDYFAGPLSLATVPIGLLVFGPNPPKASATLVQKIPMSQIQKVNPALYKKLQENPNFGRPGRTAPTPTPTPEKPKEEPKEPKNRMSQEAERIRKQKEKREKEKAQLGSVGAIGDVDASDAASAAAAAAERRRKRRGAGIKESAQKKRLKSPTEIMKKIPGYYDGKPAPLGFPIEKPPEMINGLHPDLVDGKKVSQRFNKLDPISAKAMPPTGNPHIDKKVEKAKKEPK